jgi:anti-sigma-K factor RskA
MRDDETIGVEERELDDFALEALAEAHATVPPARLRERLVGAVERDGTAARTRRALGRWRLVGTIAATVALVSTGLLVHESFRNAGLGRALEMRAEALIDMTKTKDDLAQRLDEQGRTLVGLREALDAQGQMLRVLSGPRTLTASLAPKEGFAGSGRVLVDADTGEAHVVLAGLPSPGPGKTYELWAIRGDRPPEPAGLVTMGTTPATAARVERITAPSEVAAFAVSIEPSAGSTSPTGPIVLVGKVT